MTVQSSVITGADATNYAADRITLMPCLRFSAGAWSTTGYGADVSASGFPATLAFDGCMAHPTKPNSAAQVWYYRGTIPTTSDDSVDALFLHVNDLGGAVDVTIKLGDSATDVGDITISNTDADYLRTNQRLFMPCLQVSGDSGNTQRRFTGVTYVKIKFDAGAGQTCTPQINELAAGLQRQLDRAPAYPWDNADRDDLSETFVSGAGVQTTYTFAQNLFSLDATWQVTEATQRAKWIAFNADLRGGKNPFVFCQNPLTDPNTAYLMCRRSPGFRLPRKSYGDWEVKLSAVEQGGSILADEIV